MSKRNCQSAVKKGKRVFKPVQKIFHQISFFILCFFTWMAPLKFGLPYTYNIEQTVPQNWVEMLVQSWPTEWGVLLLLTSFLFFLFSLPRERFFQWQCGWMESAVLLWILSMLVSSFYHGFFNGSVQTTLLLCSYGLYFFLIRSVADDPFKRNLLWVYAVTAFVFTALFGFYQYYEGLEDTLRAAREMNLPQLQDSRFMTRLTGKKVFSTFIYSNSFAGYLILWIPLVVTALMNRELKKPASRGLLAGGGLFLLYLVCLEKYGYLHFYGLLGACLPVSVFYLLFLTQSKGAILSLSLAALAWAVPFLRRTRGVMPWVLVFLTGAGALIFYSLKKEALSSSLKVRAEYTQASLAMIRENPVFGVGPGQYGTVYMAYKEPAAEEVQMAHNCFLQLWAETGLVPLVSFLLLCGLSLVSAYRNRALSDIGKYSLCTALTGFYLHNAQDFDLYVPSLGYALFFILAQIPESPREEPSAPRKTLHRFLGYQLRFLSLSGAVLMVFLYYRISESMDRQEKAFRWAEAGNYALASAHMKEAVQLYPFLPTYFVNSAQFHLCLRQFGQAGAAYQKALEMSPRNAMTWLLYARALRMHEEFDKKPRKEEILKAYQRACQHYPSSRNIRSEMEDYANSRTLNG